MSNQEVKLILDEEGNNRRLIVRKKDGTEYNITVFSGSGYYTDVWLRTDAEIAESETQRNAAYDSLADDVKAIQQQQKPWYKRLLG